MNFRKVLSLGLIALTLSALAAKEAYMFPEKLGEFASVLATVTSILIGMSLAVSAIVSAPFKSSESFKDKDYHEKRIEKVFYSVERDVLEAQSILFYAYLFSLACSLVLWWCVYPFEGVVISFWDRILSAAAAFSFVFSFVLSIRTPSLLKELMKARRELGN